MNKIEKIEEIEANIATLEKQLSNSRLELIMARMNKQEVLAETFALLEIGRPIDYDHYNPTDGTITKLALTEILTGVIALKERLS